MKTLARALLVCARRGWRALRALTGDDAYERYLEHARRHHAALRPMSAAAFYRRQLELRWSTGPNRCC